MAFVCVSALLLFCGSVAWLLLVVAVVFVVVIVGVVVFVCCLLFELSFCGVSVAVLWLLLLLLSIVQPLNGNGVVRSASVGGGSRRVRSSHESLVP